MASLDELMQINGIGRTKAIELKAAMELGVRLSNAAQMKLGKITSSKMAGQWIVQELKDAYQEHLVALYLNTKNEIIKKKMIFIGGLNSAVAHPREIFREAVRFRRRASSLAIITQAEIPNPHKRISILHVA